MTKSRLDDMTRRQLMRRLIALGLTTASATSLLGAWGTRAQAQARYKLSFANIT